MKGSSELDRILFSTDIIFCNGVPFFILSNNEFLFLLLSPMFVTFWSLDNSYPNEFDVGLIMFFFNPY